MNALPSLFDVVAYLLEMLIRCTILVLLQALLLRALIFMHIVTQH